MSANIWRLKRDMVEIGRRIWTRGFVAANDGNFSIRIGNMLLTTPTGISKGFMSEADLIITDMQGRVIEGSKKPSSELKMHIEVYKQRKDIKAVVHAHPPYSTAYACCRIPLNQCLLPELIVMIGSVPVARYATPSSDEVPASISKLIHKSDAILLANHGLIVSSVEDIYAAYYKMESIEHYAKIYTIGKSIGELNFLSSKDVENLIQVRKNMGIKGEFSECLL